MQGRTGYKAWCYKKKKHKKVKAYIHEICLERAYSESHKRKEPQIKVDDR